MLKAVLSILLLTSLYAEEQSDPKLYNPLYNRTVTYNLPAAVTDTNKSNWNVSNWEEQLTGDSGYGSIGNTMMLMNDNEFFKKGLTTDMSEVTVEKFNEDEDLPDAAHGYSETFKSEMSAKSLSNTSYIANSDPDVNTLNCFIARDLPFRYKCEETGLVYGGETLAQAAPGGAVVNMDGMSGKQALNMCKENCKRQLECVEVAQGSKELVELSDETFSFESDLDFETVKGNLDRSKITEFVTFEVNATSTNIASDENLTDSKVLLDISYVDSEGKDIYLAKNVWTRFMRNTEKLFINEKIREVKFKMYSYDVNTTVSGTINNISVSYKDSSKYICPAIQDIADQDSEAYAFKCPDGDITDFNGFKICSSGVIKGDNDDGTYSDRDTCKSICNIKKKCNIEIGTFDATIFEQIREGRLGRISADGEFTTADKNSISDDVDCTNARRTNQRIINEVAFDAHNVPYQTVLNGALVSNVDRPRVLSTSNANFDEQKKEEWKDSAYDNMLESGSYSKSDSGLGEDTKSNFAFSINLADGTHFGDITSTSRRELVWKLKPSAHSYVGDTTNKLYLVIKADVEHYGYSVNGRERLRDQIWYVKTSEADTFTPFVRADNYASATSIDISKGDIKPTLIYNADANFDAKTFQGSSWIDSSFSGVAPSFKTVSFVPDEFWYEFNVLDSMGDIIYKLPGLARSSSESNTGIVTNTYTGSFDGTGEGVVGFEVYAMYSKNSLTYQDLKNKIDTIDNSQTHQVENDSAKIYKSTEEKMFRKFVEPDNIETDSGVDIFQYGTADKNTLKARIRPKPEHVGKNAFFYIFIY